jgi:hypothetical protein
VTGVVVTRSSVRICIAQADRVDLWDMRSMLLVESIQLPGRVIAIVAVGIHVYCGLENGRIVRMDPAGSEMVINMTGHVGEVIAGLGEERGKLTSTLADGRTLLWVDDKPVQKAAVQRGATVLPHPRFPVALCRTKALVSLIHTDSMATIPLHGELQQATCCCWHRRLPLCAVGHIDGSVSAWRVPM